MAQNLSPFWLFVLATTSRRRHTSLDPANDQPSDYYLIPRLDVEWSKLLLHEHNGARIDTYRFDTLAFFIGLAACARIEEAA